MNGSAAAEPTADRWPDRSACPESLVAETAGTAAEVSRRFGSLTEVEANPVNTGVAGSARVENTRVADIAKHATTTLCMELVTRARLRHLRV
jgi:hypothetical protein